MARKLGGMSAAAVAAPRVPLGAVLRAPGFAWLFGASMVGRVPGAAMGLVLVLRTRELTGSFAAGGLVAGLNALAVGVTAPLLGRLVDRRGQVPVLAGCAALNVAGAARARPAARRAPGLAAAAGCAIAAGAGFPPLGACLRTALPALLPDKERRHAAFALESATTELTYVSGPLLVAVCVATGGPGTAAFACAALTALGVGGFLAHPAPRAFRPAGRRRARPRRRAARPGRPRAGARVRPRRHDVRRDRGRGPGRRRRGHRRRAARAVGLRVARRRPARRPRAGSRGRRPAAPPAARRARRRARAADPRRRPGRARRAAPDRRAWRSRRRSPARSRSSRTSRRAAR